MTPQQPHFARLFFCVVIFSFTGLSGFSAFPLWAQDANSKRQVLDTSPQGNDRGYERASALSVDDDIINEQNGNLMYVYPLYSEKQPGGFNLDIKLTYNGNVEHRLIRYDKFDPSRGYTLNAPEWILSVNGFAVQVFNYERNWFSSAYRQTNPSTAPSNAPTQITDQNVPLLIPGYHYTNFLGKYDYNSEYAVKDIITLMTGDGGTISLYLDTPYPAGAKRTGLYKPLDGNTHCVAWVTAANAVPEQTPDFRRRMILKREDGTTFIFEEHGRLYNPPIDLRLDYYDHQPKAFLLTEIYHHAQSVAGMRYNASPLSGRPLLGELWGKGVRGKYLQFWSGANSLNIINGGSQGYGSLDYAIGLAPVDGSNDQPRYRYQVTGILDRASTLKEFTYQLYQRTLNDIQLQYGQASSLSSATVGLKRLKEIRTFLKGSTIVNPVNPANTRIYEYEGANLSLSYLNEDVNPAPIQSASFNTLGRDPFFANMIIAKETFTGNASPATKLRRDTFSYNLIEKTNGTLLDPWGAQSVTRPLGNGSRVGTTHQYFNADGSESYKSEKEFKYFDTQARSTISLPSRGEPMQETRLMREILSKNGTPTFTTDYTYSVSGTTPGSIAAPTVILMTGKRETNASSLAVREWLYTYDGQRTTASGAYTYDVRTEVDALQLQTYTAFVHIFPPLSLPADTTEFIHRPYLIDLPSQVIVSRAGATFSKTQYVYYPRDTKEWTALPPNICCETDTTSPGYEGQLGLKKVFDVTDNNRVLTTSYSYYKSRNGYWNVPLTVIPDSCQWYSSQTTSDIVNRKKYQYAAEVNGYGNLKEERISNGSQTRVLSYRYYPEIDTMYKYTGGPPIIAGKYDSLYRHQRHSRRTEKSYFLDNARYTSLQVFPLSGEALRVQRGFDSYRPLTVQTDAVDANGNATKFDYDDIGRLLYATHPYDYFLSGAVNPFFQTDTLRYSRCEGIFRLMPSDIPDATPPPDGNSGGGNFEESSTGGSGGAIPLTGENPCDCSPYQLPKIMNPTAGGEHSSLQGASIGTQRRLYAETCIQTANGPCFDWRYRDMQSDIFIRFPASAFSALRQRVQAQSPGVPVVDTSLFRATVILPLALRTDEGSVYIQGTLLDANQTLFLPPTPVAPFGAFEIRLDLTAVAAQLMQPNAPDIELKLWATDLGAALPDSAGFTPIRKALALAPAPFPYILVEPKYRTDLNRDHNFTARFVYDQLTQTQFLKHLDGATDSTQFNRRSDALLDGAGRLIRTWQQRNPFAGTLPTAGSAADTLKTTYNFLSQPVSVSDALGYTTRTTYDLYGRPSKLTTHTTPTTPLASSTRYDSTLYYSAFSAIPETYRGTKVYPFDLQGSWFEVKVSRDESGKRAVSILNAKGWTIRSVQNPDPASAAPDANLTTDYYYDALGRPLHIRQAHDQALLFSYDGWGNVSETFSIDKGTEKFKYDAFGQLRFSQTAKQAAAQTSGNFYQFSFYRYDRLGRKVSEGFANSGAPWNWNSLNPDITEWFETPEYDGATLLRKWFYDRKPSTSNAQNNAVGNGNTGGFSWSASTINEAEMENLKGNLAAEAFREQDGAWGYRYYSYDARNRVKWVRAKEMRVGGAPQVEQTSYDYNSQNQPTATHTYSYNASNGFSLFSTYNGKGLPEALSVQTDEMSSPRLVERLSYNPNANLSGRFSMRTSSDTLLWTTFGYDTRNRVTAIQTRNSAGTSLLSHQYAYTANSNLSYDYRQRLPMSGASDALTTVLNYSYDNVNRFTGQWQVTYTPDDQEIVLPNAYLSCGFDSFGRLTTLNRYTLQGVRMDSLQYRYYTGNKLDHAWDGGSPTAAVNDVKNQSAGNYTYDASGNLTADVQKGISWIGYNERNLMRYLTRNGQTHEYRYDGRGNRTEKVKPDGTFEAYRRGGNGELLALYGNNGLATKLMLGSNAEAYWTDGQQEERPEGEPTEAGKGGTVSQRQLNLNFLLTDRLGNVEMVVSEDGEIVRTSDYDAWGYEYEPNRVNLNSLNTKGKAIGVEFDDESNTLATGVRQYSPALGIMFGAEPRYLKYPHYTPFSYGGNNPLGFVDIDGREIIPTPEMRPHHERLLANSLEYRMMVAYIDFRTQGQDISLTKTNFIEAKGKNKNGSGLGYSGETEVGVVLPHDTKASDEVYSDYRISLEKQSGEFVNFESVLDYLIGHEVGHLYYRLLRGKENYTNQLTQENNTPELNTKQGYWLRLTELEAHLKGLKSTQESIKERKRKEREEKEQKKRLKRRFDKFDAEYQ